MQDNPDPNLDDDDLIQAIYECHQSIATGGGCTMCDSEGVVHDAACLFVVVSNLMDERDVIESYLDAS